MSDTERIRDFQRKLYLKAKQEMSFRFYILYDKISSMRFLKEAYKRVRANKGREGVDNMTFEDVENYGIAKYLTEIQQELKEKTYKPSPVFRVYIKKANGKQRPLGIPTIKDRIVQMACKIVIEPIFEADFEDCSYGFRPKRSAHDAMKKIKELLKQGYASVLDADLSSYFDTIPHDKLMILICQRISDKDVIRLIKMWLKAPVMENGRLTGGRKNKTGTPQGGVISPLLANIYLHLLDKLVNKEGGVFKRLDIKIVRYADDFLLMGKVLRKEALDKLEYILERMGLKLNKEKTRRIYARLESFNFLGFTIRYEKGISITQQFYARGKRRWDMVPSKDSCKKVRKKITDYLKTHSHCPPNWIAYDLNAIIRGWMNYFYILHVNSSLPVRGALRIYLRNRIYRTYKRKSQRNSPLYCRKAFDMLVDKYKLIDPATYRSVSKTLVKALR
jgi:group II intron reverse transcriptase/maturase